MGNITTFFQTISTTIGAVTTILAAIIAFEKWSKGKLTKWLLKSVMDEFSLIRSEIQDIKEHLKKLELDDLKLVIMSEEMPIGERLSAGKRYISQGGNGAIKIHVKLLEEEYENELRKEE